MSIYKESDTEMERRGRGRGGGEGESIGHRSKSSTRRLKWKEHTPDFSRANVNERFSNREKNYIQRQRERESIR